MIAIFGVPRTKVNPHGILVQNNFLWLALIGLMSLPVFAQTLIYPTLLQFNVGWTNVWPNTGCDIITIPTIISYIYQLWGQVLTFVYDTHHCFVWPNKSSVQSMNIYSIFRPDHLSNLFIVLTLRIKYKIRFISFHI